jgi:hypothetical protein
MKRWYCQAGSFGDYVWAKDRAAARLSFFARHGRLPITVRKD